MDEARQKGWLQEASEVAWQQAPSKARAEKKARARLRERYEAKSRAETGRAGRHEEGARKTVYDADGAFLGQGVEISKLNRTSKKRGLHLKGA